MNIFDKLNSPIGVISGLVVIVAAVYSFVIWAIAFWKKYKTRLGNIWRQREYRIRKALWAISPFRKAIPNETLRIVARRARWRLGGPQGNTMLLNANWTVTNITRSPIRIVKTTIVPPNLDTPALVLRPNGKSYGNYAIGMKATTNVTTNFLIEPALAETGKPFKAKVLMFDQFGNVHASVVVFSPKSSQKSQHS